MFDGTARIPTEDESKPGLKEQGTSQDHPVHEPWCQECWIRGLESFVGCEDGEEEGWDGSAQEEYQYCLHRRTKRRDGGEGGGVGSR